MTIIPFHSFYENNTVFKLRLNVLSEEKHLMSLEKNCIDINMI